MTIENGKITPTLGSTKAIEDLPAPKNIKQARGLISSFSYYRKFMKDFVNIARPIMDLIKGKKDSKQPIKWTSECDEAFQKLKKQITSQPILQIFDPDRETTLSVDGSSYGIGAVLSQKDPTDNILKPVAYYSEKLPPTKKHLCSLDLEVIALSKAMRHFRKYLFLKHFTVLTDSKNLISRKITENTTLHPSRLARLTGILNTFDFDIKHIKGVDNTIPDSLSRIFEKESFNSISNNTQNLENNKFIKGQEEDRIVGAMKQVLMKKKLDENKFPKKEIIKLVRDSRKYCLDKNKVVCFTKFNKNKQLKLPYIPSSLRNELIQQAHSGLLTGNHSSIERTYNKLSNQFYWPGLYTDVRNFVTTCHACQLIKKQKFKYGRIKKDGCKNDKRIFYQLNMDILGPYKYASKDVYVLTSICNFSKFIFFRAYHKIDSKTVISYLEEIMSLFPAPRFVKTDHGSVFKSRVTRIL